MIDCKVPITNKYLASHSTLRYIFIHRRGRPRHRNLNWTDPMTYREPLPALTMSFLANTLLLLAAPVVTAIFLAQTF